MRKSALAFQLVSWLGFLLRFGCAMPPCFWFYSFAFNLYWCVDGGLSGNVLAGTVQCAEFAIVAAFWNTGSFYERDLFGSPVQFAVPAAATALVIAWHWGRICRRHCLPLEPRG